MALPTTKLKSLARKKPRSNPLVTRLFRFRYIPMVLEHGQCGCFGFVDKFIGGYGVLYRVIGFLVRGFPCW